MTAPALRGDPTTARLLILIVAFVPFFAFAEIGRVLGAHKLAAMFFSKREALGDVEHPGIVAF
ncbi:MAG TPA: hypothetical protein VLX09_16110 [Stellaceae bacterium]|nr:hypothetical protein [Stellaceae bacterium]